MLETITIIMFLLRALGLIVSTSMDGLVHILLDIAAVIYPVSAGQETGT